MADTSGIIGDQTFDGMAGEGDAENGDSSGFPVGATVLAKVRGFPAWPAVVVRDSDLPLEMQKSKPKKKPVYPVLFYSEHNYMWLPEGDLKYLYPEQAVKLAEKAKIKKTLKQAFEIAIAPPPLDEYLESIAAPPTAVYEDYVEPEPTPEPAAPTRAKRAADKPVSIARATRRATKRVSAEADSSNKRARKGKKGEAAPKAEEASEAEDGDEDVSMADAANEDENVDGEDDGNDEAASNAPRPMRIELAGPKPRGRPSTKKEKKAPPATLDDVIKSSELRTQLCKEVRYRLQKSLMTDENVDESQIPQLLEYVLQLKEIPNLEVSVIRATKVNNALRAILQLDLPPSAQSFLTVTRELLEAWDTPAEPIIRGRPEGEVTEGDLEQSVEPENEYEDELEDDTGVDITVGTIPSDGADMTPDPASEAGEQNGYPNGELTDKGASTSIEEEDAKPEVSPPPVGEKQEEPVMVMETASEATDPLKETTTEPIIDLPNIPATPAEPPVVVTPAVETEAPAQSLPEEQEVQAASVKAAGTEAS